MKRQPVSVLAAIARDEPAFRVNALAALSTMDDPRRTMRSVHCSK